MKDRYTEAPTYREFLETVESRREMWLALTERAKVPEDLVGRAREMPGPLRLLALAEDWCGDALNGLPVIARLAEEVPGMELRVLSRDENPDLMDAHLTDGTSRSIPVVMVLDEKYEEIGWWGPRPGELQRWVLDNLDLPSAERYREVRRWHARDRGRTVVAELLEVMAGAGAIP